MKGLTGSGIASAMGRFEGIVLEVTTAGEVIESNGRLDGMVDKPVLGASIASLLDEGSRRRWEAIVEQIPAPRADPGVGEELVWQTPEGPRCLTFTVIPLEVGPAQPDRLILLEMVHQRTAARLYDELAALNSDLVNTRRTLEKRRAELDHRVAEEERLRAAAEEALRLRDDVLAFVSHDLRSPLSTISMVLAQLRDDAAGSEGDPSLLAIASRAATGALHLIEDLLDIARLEQRGTLAIRPVPMGLDEVVGHASEAFGPKAREANKTLVVEGTRGITIEADPRRLSQVLTNLLDNAFKATEGGATITIRTDAMNDEASFEVEDTGSGIDEADIPRLFDRFWQAKRGHGAGLGLAICDSVVKAHGGRIEVDSAVGDGTRVRVCLPRSVPEEGQTPSQCARQDSNLGPSA